MPHIRRLFCFQTQQGFPQERITIVHSELCGCIVFIFINTSIRNLFIQFYLDGNNNKILNAYPPQPVLFPYATILTLTKEHLNSATKFYNYYSYPSNGDAEGHTSHEFLIY